MCIRDRVASCLGVSTPAVNKWESGSTYPDITLLPSLARLLKIDLNTLFSFEEKLSEKEIGRFCNEIGQEAFQNGFEAGFAAAAEKLQEYPHCDLLRFSLASLLEGSLQMSTLAPETRKEYERRLTDWYEQAAGSQDDQTREAAISVLINRHLA